MGKISVIVPAYNTEKYIRDTFDCLLAQTHKDVEVVVVNDGSTDGTQGIIDEYSAKYDIFKPVFQKNAGVSAARNNGIEHATGDYILFLDSDDVLTEGSLEAFNEALEETNADLAIGRLQSFGSVNEVYNLHADKLAKKKNIDMFDKQLLWNFLIGNKCYRRQKLIDSGVRFPLLKYSEEGAFFIEFVMTGVKITGTMGACMRYRRHDSGDESVSQSISLGLFRDFIASLTKVYNAAEKALQTSELSSEQQYDYLQEILYKTEYVLLLQFYVLIWRADDETVKCIVQEHNRLYGMMGDKMRGFVKKHCIGFDLPLLDKDEMAKNPKMSVILRSKKGDIDKFVNSVYMQKILAFELIVPRSVAEKSEAVKRLSFNQNLVILDDKGYAHKARKAARGTYKLRIFRTRALSQKLFSEVLKIRRVPPKLKKMFFGPLCLMVEELIRRRSKG